jgi:hypothetical protein
MKNKLDSKIFEYSYNVPDNSVNINALLISQLHLTTIINEVSKTVSPDIELNIRVIAPKEGSFVFQQIIEYIIATNLLSKDNIDYLANVFTVFGGIIALKVWLKGKKADNIEKNGNDVKITFNGETKNVSFNIYNIYSTDKIVNSAIQKTFEAIETDDAIDGLNIKENKNIITEIKKEDFASLVLNNEYLDGDTQEEIKPSVKLFIKNPDLVPKNPKLVKWDFLYEGITKIKATIKDQKFLDDISKTVYRVGAWDSLLADVKVISKYNEQVKVHLPESYEVVKVHKVIYRDLPKQTKLGSGFE